jgi:pyruvate formate lyase activating enzyme
MEGLVFDIKRGVTKDGPGLRTSVFLKGCPLRCAWCHNPESQSPEPERAVTTGELCGRRMTVEEVMEEVRRDAVFYKASGGGLTITGGEPLFQPEFTAALAEAANAEGIHVAVDTSGFAPWPVLERIIGSAGFSWERGLPARGGRDGARPSPGSAGFQPADLLFLYDIKCIDPAKHRDLTGVDNAPILDNLRRLDDAGVPFWIRCPLVPGLNDTDADLAALRDFIATLHHAEKVEICPYHPLGLEKYAKFGKKLSYIRREAATAEEVSRWRRTLFVRLTN